MAVGVVLYVSSLCSGLGETCVCVFDACYQRGDLVNFDSGVILFFLGGFLIVFSETSVLEQFRFEWSEARKPQQEEPWKSDARA